MRHARDRVKLHRERAQKLQQAHAGARREALHHAAKSNAVVQGAVRSQAVRAAGEARETLQLLAAAIHADSSQNLERIDEEPPFERRPRHGVPLALEEEHREVETCPCYVKVFLRI